MRQRVLLAIILFCNSLALRSIGQGQPGFLAPGGGAAPGPIISSSVGRYVTFNWGSGGGNTASYQLNIRDVTLDPNGPLSLFTNNGAGATTISLLLANRHSYKWNIYACSGANATGGRTLSTTLWFRFLNPPFLENPGNTTSSPPLPKVLSLTPFIHWDQVPEADGYWFYLSKYPYGPNNIVTNTGFGTAVIQFQLLPGTLQPGSSYAWNMTSLWGVEESPTLGALYFSVDTIPTPPDMLTASGAANSINLTWNHTSANALGQLIERKAGLNGAWNALHDVDWDAAVYTDASVVSGTTYYYRIHAYNGIGNSQTNYSGAAFFTPSGFTLNISAFNGTVTKTPDLVAYSAGTSVTLIPTPNAHYSFAGWSGDASGVGSPLVITMTANKTLLASFVPTPSSVQVGTSIGGEPIDGFTKLFLALPQIDPSYLCLVQLSKDRIHWFSFDAFAGSTPSASWRLPTLPDSEMGFCRLQISVMQKELAFMTFPLKGITDPYQANISAIFDLDYDKQGIRTYRNEVANAFPASSTQSPSLTGYRKDSAGTPFNLEYKYNDGTGKKSILFYDDHSGYDYPCDLNTEILAVADGVIDRAKSNSQKEWNGLCVLHNNGYRSYYLHLTNWADFIVQKFAGSESIEVTQGQTIGYAGNIGVVGAVNPTDFVHLHLSVYDPNEKRVDPYGEFVPAKKEPVQSILWTIHP